MKIGLSYSRCVLDIVEERVDINDVLVIIARTKFDPNELENEITRLMIDEDVTNKKGIYYYVLKREEKFLNIRAFNDNQKREAYERQRGICNICRKRFELNEMEADHFTPWHEGGKTIPENCQMLCKEDNRRKSGK